MKKLFLFTFLLSTIGFALITTPVSARSGCGDGGLDPYQPPASCTGVNEFTFDAACEFRRITNKEETCCVAICKSDAASGNLTEDSAAYQSLISFFGRTLAIRSEDQIPALINLGISSFLGVISAYAMIRGVYVGGVVRAQSTDPEKIAEANKELGVMIVAVVIAFSFIIIIQILANLLGLGSLNNLVVYEDPSNPGTTTNGDTIVIQ